MWTWIKRDALLAMIWIKSATNGFTSCRSQYVLFERPVAKTSQQINHRTLTRSRNVVPFGSLCLRLRVTVIILFSFLITDRCSDRNVLVSLDDVCFTINTPHFPVQVSLVSACGAFVFARHHTLPVYQKVQLESFNFIIAFDVHEGWRFLQRMLYSCCLFTRGCQTHTSQIYPFSLFWLNRRGLFFSDAEKHFHHGRSFNLSFLKMEPIFRKDAKHIIH